MQRCQFVKSVTERESGKFPSCCRFVGRVAVQSQQAVLPFQPQPLRDIGNGILSGASASAALWERTNSFAPRSRPSNSTSTAGRRYRFLFICTFLRYFWKVLIVSVGRGSVCRPCLLGLRVRIYYYLRGKVCFMFSLSRYFLTCVTGLPGAYSLANLP